jgi:hypothetical protein
LRRVSELLACWHSDQKAELGGLPRLGHFPSRPFLGDPLLFLPMPSWVGGLLEALRRERHRGRSVAGRAAPLFHRSTASTGPPVVPLSSSSCSYLIGGSGGTRHQNADKAPPKCRSGRHQNADRNRVSKGRLWKRQSPPEEGEQGPIVLGPSDGTRAESCTSPRSATKMPIAAAGLNPPRRAQPPGVSAKQVRSHQHGSTGETSGVA